MNAGPKSHVMFDGPAEIHRHRIRKFPLVEVVQGGRQEHQIAFAHRQPLELKVPRNHAAEIGNAVAAQQLFDRIGNQGGVIDELPAMGRVTAEKVHEKTHRRHDGIQAAEHHIRRQTQYLMPRHGPAIDLRGQ